MKVGGFIFFFSLKQWNNKENEWGKLIFHLKVKMDLICYKICVLIVGKINFPSLAQNLE